MPLLLIHEGNLRIIYMRQPHLQLHQPHFFGGKLVSRKLVLQSSYVNQFSGSSPILIPTNFLYQSISILLTRHVFGASDWKLYNKPNEGQISITWPLRWDKHASVMSLKPKFSTFKFFISAKRQHSNIYHHCKHLNHNQ